MSQLAQGSIEGVTLVCIDILLHVSAIRHRKHVAAVNVRGGAIVITVVVFVVVLSCPLYLGDPLLLSSDQNENQILLAALQLVDFGPADDLLLLSSADLHVDWKTHQ